LADKGDELSFVDFEINASKYLFVPIVGKPHIFELDVLYRGRKLMV